MPVTLTYATHSTSTDNEAGIATGWLPGALSPTGRRQAVDLGRRYPDGTLDLVISSDLGRAVETVAVAFAGRDIPVTRDARLRECDYGDWNGQPAELIARERRHRIDRPFPGGQSYRDVVAATAAFLADLVRDHDGRRVLIVAHSANRWALALILAGVPLDESMDAPFEWQPGWRYTVPSDFDPTPWLMSSGLPRQ